MAAMPYVAVPSFVARVRADEGASARALEFLILCAARAGEVRGAVWSEFDLDHAVWEIPGQRMKAGKPHRVPLSSRCLEILRAMPRKNKLVFPGRAGAMMATSNLVYLLRKLGHGDLTIHGFRSSFRDWCGEHTNFPREVCEAALAHAVGDRVELAYRRGDALEKRRALMNAWAKYCGRPAPTGATVTKLVQPTA
jgi:integrase